jgi:polyhydroxyalkanoate synthesis regulator phasin
VTEQPDWRREQLTKFAREMMTNCEPCPEGCGAMVCGNEEKKTHKEFHKDFDDTKKDKQQLKTRLDDLEDRVEALENTPPIAGVTKR